MRRGSGEQLVVAGQRWAPAGHRRPAAWRGSGIERRRRLGVAGAAGLDRDQVRVEAAKLSAASIPAITASAGRVRCSSSTPIRARVPAPSPSRRAGRRPRTVDGRR